MAGEVEIVAVGARTPVGLYAESTAAAVRAGINQLCECPLAPVDSEGEPMMVAADPRIGFEAWGAARLGPMAQSVVDEAIRKIGDSRTHVGLYVLLALPEPRPGIPADLGAMDARLVEDLNVKLRERGVRSNIAVAGRGHAAVATAVERVLRSTDGGMNVLSLVVGVDSLLHPETLLWLEHNDLIGPTARSGLVPGEAAGSVLFAPTDLRRQLNLPHLATVKAVGLAQETCLPGSESGSFGAGMTQAVRGAVRELQLPGQAVDMIFNDINGERYRSEEWGFVTLNFSAAFKTGDYEAPASCWGDVGAASGALGSILAVQSWARGYARGPRALVMTGSSNGVRGAILLQDPKLGMA